MDELKKSFISLFLLFLVTGIAFFFTSNDNLEGFCEDDFDCIIKLISQNKNASFCNSISEKDKCYTRSSEILNKVELCGRSENETRCVIKNAVFNLDSSVCNQINTQPYCVFQVSIAKNNMSECDNSNNVSHCYFSFAIAKSNKKACDFSEKYKNSCLLKFTNETE